METTIEIGSPAWLVLMLLAGLAVGAAIAILRVVLRKGDDER